MEMHHSKAVVRLALRRAARVRIKRRVSSVSRLPSRVSPLLSSIGLIAAHPQTLTLLTAAKRRLKNSAESSAWKLRRASERDSARWATDAHMRRITRRQRW